MSVARVGRRRFLAWLGGGTVVVGAGLGALRTSGYSVPAEVKQKLAALEPWQFVVVEAFGRRMLAPHPISIGLYTDQYMRDLAATDRRDVGRFIAYLEHVAPLASGHAHRFTNLPPDAQDRVLEAVETSSVNLLRAGFQALKAMAMMAYFRRPGSWQEIGYSGPVVDWGGGG